jgi:DNA-binding NarL/FixJ family response regulator
VMIIRDGVSMIYEDPMKTIRILLIEDNRILRESIAAMVNGEADMAAVGAFGDNGDTLVQVRKLNPHVVLLDLGLRNQNGIRATAVLTKEFPETDVIGMGLSPSQLDFIELAEAGASGLIFIDASIEVFLETIRSVVRGSKVLPPSLAGSLFSQVIERARKKETGKPVNEVWMTKREREVIPLIADGLSNKEIAQRLNVSIYTVKSHVHSALDKLSLHSRVQVAKFFHNDEAS